MAITASEIAAFTLAGLAYLSALFHFGQLGYRWLLEGRPRCGAWRGWIAGVRAWLLGCRVCECEEQRGLDAKIRCFIERERIRCMQTFARPFLHFAGLVLLAAMLLDATNILQDPSENTLRHRVRALRFNRLLETLLFFALCKVFVNIPRYVTSRTIAVAFLQYCVIQLVKSALLLDIEEMLVDRPVSQASVVFSAIIVCNSRITIPCCVLLWGAEGVLIHRRTSGAVMTDVLSKYSNSILWQQLFLGISYCLLLICLESAVWAASRYVLEVKASSKTEATVRRLLSALCDAVVTLSPDLRISKRAPKLANLLLQGNPARALQGTPFVDLLVDSDKERFRHFLERVQRAEEEDDEASDEPSPAQALNVSLRDSTGTNVQIQLFHSYFRDDSNKIGHLLGICEAGDAAGRQVAGDPARLRETTPRTSATVPSGAQSEASWESETTLAFDSASVAFDRARTSAEEQDVLTPLQQGEEEVHWRRLQQEECGIVFRTLRFRVGQQHVARPIVDANLLELENLTQWVAEWSSSRAWLQDLVNAAVRPVRSSSWPDASKPPAFVSFNVAFQGTCALPPDFLSNSGQPGGGDPTSPPMRLAVGRVRLFRGRGRSPSRSRALGAASRDRRSSVQPAVIGAAGPSSSRSSAAGASPTSRPFQNRPPAQQEVAAAAEVAALPPGPVQL